MSQNIEKFDKAMAPLSAGGEVLRWHNPAEKPFKLCGFAWYEQDRIYRRMPKNPSHKLPEAVDSLANNTAGGQVRFRSNSKRVAVRVQMAGPPTMDHFAATGVSGFDCCIELNGKYVFAGVSRFNRTAVEYDALMINHPGAAMRNIIIDFPLYQGVKQVEFGLDPDASIEAPPAFAIDKPVVIYGTSITQGGCASRPGMAYTNILSHRLNVEIYNLGFSGSGKGEPEVAHVISEIPNPAMLVLDYEGNSRMPGNYEKTMPEFIRILRSRHPRVPMLVIPCPPFARDHFVAEERAKVIEHTEIARKAVEACKKAGDANISFFDYRPSLPANYTEGTVDGVHCTDLGFLNCANALEPVFREILKLNRA